jgi:hypothetical protein
MTAISPTRERVLPWVGLPTEHGGYGVGCIHRQSMPYGTTVDEEKGA